MDDHPRPSQNIVATAVVFEIGIGVVAWLAGWMLELDPPLLKRILWDPAAVAWGVAGSLPMIAALLLATRFPVGPLRSLMDLVRRMIGPLFRGCSLADFALISLVAGIGEELLFRGVIQHTIGERYGAWVGILAGGVAFGLAHPITRTYALLAGLMGIYLGWLYWASGNLLAPMITHALYDLVALSYLMRHNAAVAKPVKHDGDNAA